MEESRRSGWTLVLPAAVLVAFVLVYPVVQSIVISVIQGTTPGSSGGQRFVWFENYGKIFANPIFWTSAGNTLVFTGITIPAELVLALGLSVMLNKAFRGRGLVRLAVLFPWALPTALNALIWRWMYNSEFGVFNSILLQAHLTGKPVDWLGKIPLAMISMAIVSIWKTSSFMALIILAGLQTIPEELYEAGVMDGTRPWTAFWRITLPIVRPTVLVALLLRSMDALRAFDLPFNLTRGGPVDSTQTLSLYAYKVIFEYTQFNLGAGVTIVQFLIILALSLGYIRFMRGGME